MGQENEAQRLARYDGTQLAFSMVLRELVRGQLPNEQIRAGRRDKLCRNLEAAKAIEEGEHERAAIDAAIQTVESIFAAGRG